VIYVNIINTITHSDYVKFATQSKIANAITKVLLSNIVKLYSIVRMQLFSKFGHLFRKLSKISGDKNKVYQVGRI
jgi:hypothetical protein